MKKEKKYRLLYQNMDNGVYNKLVRTWEKNLAVSSEISVDLVKQACKENEVNFEDFLTFARKKKKEEKL